MTTKFTNGDDEGENESGKEDNENPANIIGERRGGFWVFFLTANISRVLPPLIVQKLDDAFLLEF